MHTVNITTSAEGFATRARKTFFSRTAVQVHVHPHGAAVRAILLGFFISAAHAGSAQRLRCGYDVVEIRAVGGPARVG